ncbi:MULTISPECIES: Spy/CpxP family protein refolding chaperone [Legionella]|uniref:Periplasmic heavy metal sensor n=1 Tax=Legionella septentrionalis TaxID=2498109 RepID=A0A433JL28_9GAMM|nr:MULTISPECIES: Spy/CpxP family protein refolding chaperone [Legionella]MCP0913451.1 Spy/CpxP family protein refolding chaperone [Legionella sp. 27cVA30]RUQ89771.1 periplasmic heavy metal sensor [Legionella septentrionalis]RUQ99559.1 periplasmic heavy metal sensor [Legionella septentrionalis]RUR09814.1 periplasmic heavy metal sensor [Legionella septentrionalis]RUR13641.1 periplasmic heavy metal sensor [Legionella septentrionalis]
MMKQIILLPLLALSLAFSPVTFANKGDGHCTCMHMKKMMQELNLTPEQQTKIKEIKDNAKSNMQAKREEMMSLKKQMKELVRSEKMDEAKLDQLINQKKELMASKMKAKIMMKNQIYNVLDAQQKAKFAAMMDKWEQEKSQEMDDDSHDD